MQREQNLWKLVNSSRISLRRHFVSAQRDSSPPEFSLLLFSLAISVRKWAMSIWELCGRKRLVFFWSANRTVIVAQQSSQMQDIKRQIKIFDFRFRHPSNNHRCRAARSFNAAEHLLWTEAVMLQDGCNTLRRLCPISWSLLMLAELGSYIRSLFYGQLLSFFKPLVYPFFLFLIKFFSVFLPILLIKHNL